MCVFVGGGRMFASEKFLFQQHLLTFDSKENAYFNTLTYIKL